MTLPPLLGQPIEGPFYKVKPLKWTFKNGTDYGPHYFVYCGDVKYQIITKFLQYGKGMEYVRRVTYINQYSFEKWLGEFKTVREAKQCAFDHWSSNEGIGQFLERIETVILGC